MSSLVRCWCLLLVVGGAVPAFGQQGMPGQVVQLELPNVSLVDQDGAPVGCLECRMTGYYGRIGLYEIMTLTPALRRLIGAKQDFS